MTKEQLFDAIGGIDEQAIENSELRRRGQAIPFPKIAAAAACFCLMALGAAALNRGDLFGQAKMAEASAAALAAPASGSEEMYAEAALASEPAEAAEMPETDEALEEEGPNPEPYAVVHDPLLSNASGSENNREEKQTNEAMKSMLTLKKSAPPELDVATLPLTVELTAAEFDGSVLTLLLENSSGYTIEYSDVFTLQQLQNDQWVTLEPKIPITFHGTRIPLQDLESVSLTADLSSFTLIPGKYRVEMMDIYAEFELQ